MLRTKIKFTLVTYRHENATSRCVNLPVCDLRGGGGGEMSSHSSSGEICPSSHSAVRSFVGLNQRPGRVKHEWGRIPEQTLNYRTMIQ